MQHLVEHHRLDVEGGHVLAVERRVDADGPGVVEVDAGLDGAAARRRAGAAPPDARDHRTLEVERVQPVEHVLQVVHAAAGLEAAGALWSDPLAVNANPGVDPAAGGPARRGPVRRREVGERPGDLLGRAEEQVVDPDLELAAFATVGDHGGTVVVDHETHPLPEVDRQRVGEPLGGGQALRARGLARVEPRVERRVGHGCGWYAGRRPALKPGRRPPPNAAAARAAPARPSIGGSAPG